MGIRDTSYYGWSESIVTSVSGGVTLTLPTFEGTVISNLYQSGTDWYVCGFYKAPGEVSSNGIVYKTTNNGSSWTIVDKFGSSAAGNTTTVQVIADLSGNFYTVSYAGRSNANIFGWCVRKSTSGISGTFIDVDRWDEVVSGLNVFASALAVDSKNNIYVGGKYPYSPSSSFSRNSMDN